MTNILKLKFPTNKKKSKMIVESGHIYTNEHPNINHQVSATWGKLLSNYLTLFGAETEKWLFIDDYNPQFEEKLQELDINDYVNSLSQWGFAPDKVVYESDLVEHAKEVIKYLQKHYYAGQNQNGKIILHKGKIILYDPTNDKYMCSLLDACLYSQKLEQAEGCITILDKQYASQQKGTLTILKKIGIDTKTIYPFFYSTSDSTSITKSYEPNNLFFVQPAIDLLQIVAKLSGSVSLNLSLEMKVGNYGI
ncbi:hypothetical protein HN385_05160 [archaeon]|jgi:hypothetical protein|nr:hypothetical protein [archaeon]MBT3451409.1 hypothetical protein [archaeon]MBT6869246.1 hypothetical protein [archaeon]MBT7193644.1 hypothetical protein [archaeon]MBT7380262.1 hypothetical protein [archaeon]